MFNSRGFNFFMAFVCYQLLITALYFQYVDGMEPCPLCIFQRVAVFALALWFFVQALHQPLMASRWNILYNLGGLITVLIGGGISTRHAYLQSLPANEVPSCGPSLDYLMDILPFTELLNVVLKGSGECAKVSWDFMGITMPAWLLLFFIGCAGIFVWRLYRQFKPSNKVF